MCLPLAVIGVAAGATPGAEAARSGPTRTLAYTAEWWGLTGASIVLVLICYGAVLRQQLCLADGAREPLIASLRRAAMDVPFVLVALLLLALPLLPAMLLTARFGFGAAAALATLAALALQLYGWFAWTALAAINLRSTAPGTATDSWRVPSPIAALGASYRLVRGRWRAILLLGFSLLAAVLVFVLLTGIFIGVAMGLAGQDAPGAQAMALSRWLMALILALPVVYGGAVTVTAWRAASLSAESTRP